MLIKQFFQERFMVMLPSQLAPIILTFAPVFKRRTWEHAVVLLWGAILAPGRHKALTDWARQLLLQLRRWLPERELAMVADGGFAALDLLTRLAGLRRPITCITRLRLDARLYAGPAPRRPGKPGRPRLVGARLPNLQQVLANPRTRWKTVTRAN
jgi:hypothetical protein